MRRAALLFLLCLSLSLTVAVSVASADPVNSPRVDEGRIVCGDVEYLLVSPFGAPVAQAVTANGSNSTSVTILILHKAARFPQSKLTQCTAFPPDEPPFQTLFLITPVG